MRIRTAQIDDASSWLKMRQALWPDAADNEAEMAACLADPRGETFVADDSGALVGFSEATLRDHAAGCTSAPVGYVEGWYVAPAARGRGVGRALVAAAEAWAASRGAVEMASDTEIANHQSIAAHAALGFSEAERIVCFAKRIGEAPPVR